MIDDFCLQCCFVGIFFFENVEVFDFVGFFEVFLRICFEFGVVLRCIEDLVFFDVFIVFEIGEWFEVMGGFVVEL